MTTTRLEAGTTPRVWIGCLACYNEGRLVGDWFGAELADSVTTYEVHGADSRADSHDELWCFDHDNIPVAGELSPLVAAAWGRCLAEVDPHLRPALCAWVDSGDYVSECSGDLPSVSDFEDRYCGQWEDFSDYAHELAEETGLLEGIPVHVSQYFDWDSWCRDLACDYVTADAPSGSVFVFRSY